MKCFKANLNLEQTKNFMEHLCIYEFVNLVAT